MRMRLLDIYRKQLAKHTCLFEGGDEMLAALERRGLAWGIVTNKPGWLTDPLLIEVNLHKRARAVVSGDTLPRTQAASRCRCCTPRRPWAWNPRECVYVGDAERDMQAAQAAGMYALVAGFGYLGDDDRADDLVLAWLARHAARSASTGSTSRRAPRETTEPHELRVAHRRPSPRSPRRSSATWSARCARRGAPRTLRGELAKRARAGSLAKSELRARTAELLRAERGAGARRRRERLAPGAGRQQRNLPQAGARSVRTRPGRGAAPRSRNAKKPSSNWSSPSSVALAQARKNRRRRIERERRESAGKLIRPDRKPRQGAGPPAARDAQSLHRAAPPRSARPLGRDHAASRGRARRHVRALRFHRAGRTSQRRARRAAPRPAGAHARIAQHRGRCQDAARCLHGRRRSAGRRSAPHRARAATRSRWNNACASSARRVTGSSSKHSPEFAVLFLPGDQFLSAALAERPDLIDSALKQRIIVTTPSTLMALLKVIAYGWRQTAVTENAREIRELGQDLHKRLDVFVNHLQKVGRSLGNAVESFNAAVGSMERNVMPQARKFHRARRRPPTLPSTVDPIEQAVRMPGDGDRARSRRTHRHDAHTFMSANDFRSRAGTSAGAAMNCAAASSWSRARAPASAAPWRWRWRGRRRSHPARPHGAQARSRARRNRSARRARKPASCRSTSNARWRRTTKPWPPPSRSATAGSTACCTTPPC